MSKIIFYAFLCSIFKYGAESGIKFNHQEAIGKNHNGLERPPRILLPASFSEDVPKTQVAIIEPLVPQISHPKEPTATQTSLISLP